VDYKALKKVCVLSPSRFVHLLIVTQLIKTLKKRSLETRVGEHGESINDQQLALQAMKAPFFFQLVCFGTAIRMVPS